MNNNSEEKKKLALGRMQALCSRSEKCESDIRGKLANFDLLPDQIEEIIESLKDDQFIDDRRYANFFSRDKFKFNQWGKIKIRQSLYFKGISEEIIELSLSQIEEEDYFSLLLKIIRVKNKSLKETNHLSRKAKLYRFAAQKGFESELIYRAISEI